MTWKWQPVARILPETESNHEKKWESPSKSRTRRDKAPLASGGNMSTISLTSILKWWRQREVWGDVEVGGGDDGEEKRRREKEGREVKEEEGGRWKGGGKVEREGRRENTKEGRERRVEGKEDKREVSR